MSFVEVGKIRAEAELEGFAREGRDPETLMRTWSKIRTRCSVRRADGGDVSSEADAVIAQLNAGVENGVLVGLFRDLQCFHDEATWLIRWEHGNAECELRAGMSLATAMPEPRTSR